MKTIFTIALLAMTSSFAYGQSYPERGSGYCSYVSSDGYWAFAFGDTSTHFQCRRAREAIRSYTFAPITHQKSGLYSQFGWNEVYVDCLGYRDQRGDYGEWALQDAFRAAQLSGRSYCKFEVY